MEEITLHAFWQQLSVNVRRALIPITINCHTTDASARGFCPQSSRVHVFLEEDGQTITSYDAAPGFTAGDLDDDAAPSVAGLIIRTGDAEELIGLGLVAGSIVNGGSLAMTAVVPTRRGASSTGVSASYNICATLSLTGLDIDSEIATTRFYLDVIYRQRRAES